MPRSRSFTRLTMRVGLLHLGQSVDFVVSITFLRSPVLAILAIGRVFLLLGVSLHTRATELRRGSTSRSFACLLSQRDCLETAWLAASSLHQGRRDVSVRLAGVGRQRLRLGRDRFGGIRGR